MVSLTSLSAFVRVFFGVILVFSYFVEEFFTLIKLEGLLHRKDMLLKRNLYHHNLFCKIHFNIVLLFIPKTPKLFLSQNILH
jgi:hypothetical protein